MMPDRRYGKFFPRRLALAIAAGLAFLSLAFEAGAQDDRPLSGVALVIGQSKYEHLAPLPNPANDADAIEALLADLGFQSVRRTDRDASSLARDLERFAEDAAEADVAVLYYSGHGIEAGGENFLVPVDADLSALDAAATRLVPVSALIEKLKATVPVAIVMLDACRDNPFPEGALLRPGPGDTASPVGVSGLVATRSVEALDEQSVPAEPATGRENVGAVIAFAAEPGKVALDGDAGGNSPYAAAVLRHLDAMAGEEFGMVMRMVAEEVYLKTAGAQRPWINESLRRQLYFGEAPPEMAGPEGTILRERRQLLLSIADLPDPERKRVQAVADSGQVPMDAVFGVLRAMGEDAPTDPSALEEVLRAKADMLREMMGRQQALAGVDPEIGRLMDLADRAIAEGAIDAALEFQTEVAELAERQREEIGDAQQEIDARILELADVDERRAETFLLAFKHRFAAEEYEGIAREIETIDPERAYRLARKAIAAYIEAGRFGRGAIELVAGHDLAKDQLRYAEDNYDRGEVADIRSDVAYLLFLTGETIRNVPQIEEARAIFEGIVPVVDERGTPEQRLEVRRRLGSLLASLGALTHDQATLDEAVSVLDAALSALPPEAAPMKAGLERALAMALVRAGDVQDNAAPIIRAIAILDAQAAGITAETAPLDWATAQESLGAAKLALGRLSSDPARFREAVGHYRSALAQRPVERMPRANNDATFALAEALRELGAASADAGALREAAELHGIAISDRSFDYENVRWTDSLIARGLTFQALAALTRDPADGGDAVASFNEAFFLFRRNSDDAEPEAYVDNSVRIAAALEILAGIDGKASRLALAVEARGNALDVARTLSGRAGQLATLEEELERSRAALAAAGPASLERDGAISARFETLANSWSTERLESGEQRLVRARAENTAERWNDAAYAFRNALDTSFAGVSPADRARMQKGYAESLAGAAAATP